VLTAGGEPAVSFRAMEEAAAKAAATGGAEGASEGLPLTVLRQGAVVEVTAELGSEPCGGTGRLLHWAGGVLRSTTPPTLSLLLLFLLLLSSSSACLCEH
jgi:hypothetical protein